MNAKPLVSIIMPTYNCGRFISESIESVLAQTVTDWDLWIVDDCSTDNTAGIVQKYTQEHPNIFYFCMDRNGGPAAARNVGLRQAQGRYIAFLDSDDLWKPKKLEKQIAFMEQNGVFFSATGYEQMDENGNSLHLACFPPEKTSYNKCIRLSNPIGNLTVMYNQEALGRFEVPMIQKRNDFALWLQILKKTKYCYGLDKALATYRIRKTGSVSSNKLGQARYHWQLYHEIEGHSFLRSTFELGCWAFVKGTGIGLDRRATGSDEEDVSAK